MRYRWAGNRLRVLVEDEHGIIEVTDSGARMRSEVQARVFEPSSTTKGERGTGFRLAVVFGIVEQHGGHIEVRSTLGDERPSASRSRS